MEPGVSQWDGGRNRESYGELDLQVRWLEFDCHGTYSQRSDFRNTIQ